MKVIGSRKVLGEQPSLVSMSFHPRQPSLYLLLSSGQLSSMTVLKAPQKDGQILLPGAKP